MFWFDAPVHQDAGTGTSVNVGQATETATAHPVGRSKSKTLGQSTSSETAQALARFKVRLLGQATETDYAIPLVFEEVLVFVETGAGVVTSMAGGGNPTRVEGG